MAADGQYFLPMEEKHYDLDQNRQSWANLCPTSAKRAPLRRQLFMAVATVVGNDVNLHLQILIEQAKNLSGDGLDPIQKPCVQGKFSPRPWAYWKHRENYGVIMMSSTGMPMLKLS